MTTHPQALSSIRARVNILGARLRMHLSEDDVMELIGILDDADRAQAHWLRARSRLSSEYWQRTGGDR